MIEKRQIIEWSLIVSCLVVSSSETTTLLKLYDACVLACPSKIKCRVVQTKLICNLGFGQITCLRVSNFKSEKILRTNNNILENVLSLDIPSFRLPCSKG